MKRSLFVSEWKNIFKDKKVFIAIIAILFVPLMYAGMFLWSFWDPYDHLQDLPVAVVNADTGAEYEGEELEIGDELVNKLKENDEFQFHFVSKEEGYRDLKKQKYYLLVEIPEDFSHNATTLMDDHPKKLQLKYVPNESYNFLSSQIGETAMKEIKIAISKEVSATYAETMFDKVTEVADGLDEASDGTESLHDGAREINDGSKTLHDHLDVFSTQAILFNDGMNEAYSGAGNLKDGSSELANGLGLLTDGGDELLDASKDVQDGSNQLADGIQEVNDGAQEISEKLPELIDGTNEFSDGLTQFQDELPTQMAETIAQQIGSTVENSIDEMNEGLNELQSGIEDGLTEELTQGLTSGISAQIAETMVNQQQQQGEKLAEILLTNGLDEQTVETIVTELSAGVPEKETVQEEMEEQLSPHIVGAIDESITGIEGGFTEFKNAVNENVPGNSTDSSATEEIESQIQAAVDPVFNELHEGLDAITEGQQTLQDGLNQLADGTEQLKEGSTQLTDGQNEYVDHMQTFTEKLMKANQGASDLASGSEQLTNGMSELSEGSSQLHDGSQQLADGSKDLSQGTEKLSEGTEELHDKMHDAADEVGSVQSTDDTYDMMGDPVDVDKQEINQVPNYGTGFAPYFVSLGLFVGSLLMTIVYNMNDPAKRPRNGITWFLGKFGVVAVVGIIQALIVDAILLLGLGIEVKSVPLFIFVSIITSLVFMTLIQFLVTVFGDPGRFMAIVILILQLTTSAGTFPLELIPKVIQPLNAILPMTYTVQEFKAVISSGDYSYMWQNIAILVTYIVVFMVLTATYFVYKNRQQTSIEMEKAI